MLGALAAALLPAAGTYADEPEVKKMKNGIYAQEVRSRRAHFGMKYVVDTKTQLCFAESPDQMLTLVPCEAVARRPGWEDVITWIDPAPATE